MSPAPAIIGLGMTPMSVTAGTDSFTLAVEAVGAALADAGLERADADGLLVGSSQGIRPARLSVALARRAGLGDLRLLEPRSRTSRPRPRRWSGTWATGTPRSTTRRSNRRLDEEFVWFGRLKREKVPGYIEALESAHGAAVAHDALVIGPHTLIYRFDVLRRQERPHLAFGFGPHVCLGANLARMEARVLFDELLRTFPDFQVTGLAVRGRSTLVAMVSELPAAFGSRDPARARV
jgi:hypothetical protein